MLLGITDHVEGPRERPSAEIYAEVAELARVADESRARYFWLTEHHDHLHHGHLPTPLLMAMHLASQVKHLLVGTAVICLNLHHPIDVAEQVAVADTLCSGRLAPGFGSGSTPEESTLLGLPQTTEVERHARFDEALHIIRKAWGGSIVPSESNNQRCSQPPSRSLLPLPRSVLWSRCWSAVNSVGAARIAGAHNLNILFSHLRTPDQYRQYTTAYRESGGKGLIAANRPVYVGRTDSDARAEIEPALRTLWRRFQREGKIASDIVEPADVRSLCDHPINFIVGDVHSVARQICELFTASPFDVLNAEVRWAGLSHERTQRSLQLLATDVMPIVSRVCDPLL